MQFALLFSIFVIATCGLVYELIAGALASYLLGDSITQFSTIIGTYLFAMGIGSWLSSYVQRNLTFVFIQVEILIGLVGGFSAAILFVSFEYVQSFRILLYSLVVLTGTLVGLEIPLLMRILKGYLEFKDLVARVFTFDYIGALLASLLFPLVLVPHLGLIRSAFLFGIFNVVVAIWTLHIFRRDVAWIGLLRTAAVVSLVALGLGFAYSDNILSWSETAAYQDKVIYSKTSKYQRIVLTKAGSDLRLFLNGNLQFSSRDEYRYHEALVHPGLSTVENPRRVLVLGGGDGFAVREILKYPSIEAVTLVDLDPGMSELFRDHDALSKLNEGALSNPKVKVINADAFVWLKENTEKFDFIAVDFPDPSNYSIGKLYSNTFYRVLKTAITDKGVITIQSTSPFVAKKSFWCIDATLRSVGLQTAPYHAYVPSFGEWGFIIASNGGYEPPSSLPEELKFASLQTIREMFHFPSDMRALVTSVNKLNNQQLVRFFEEEWSEYIH